MGPITAPPATFAPQRGTYDAPATGFLDFVAIGFSDILAIDDFPELNQSAFKVYFREHGLMIAAERSGIHDR